MCMYLPKYENVLDSMLRVEMSEVYYPINMWH